MPKRKIKLNSIKTKLMISMISLCIIPLIGIGAYNESKIILSDKLATTSGQTLKEVSNSLDNYFEGFNKQLVSASKNDHLLEIDSNDQNYN